MIALSKSRRQRRLIITTGFTTLFLATVAAGLALRPHPANYVPGEKVAGVTDSLGRALPADYPGITFSDGTRQAGITFQHFYGRRSSQLPEDMGSGAAWCDYDNDGYPDLFLVNEAGPLTMTAEQVQASPARCALYHNNGDGTFTDVTEKAGLGHLKGCLMGAAWGDYDNDGHPDLFVTAYGENHLFHNDGNGHFTDVSQKAGVGGLKGFWTGASWGDYDRDGHLDLYVCGYVKYHPPRPEEVSATSKQNDTDVPFTINPSSYPPERNLLYHNNGDGTFTEVAKQAGVDDPAGRSLSATWCDFDGDGWPDLYVNNDVSMHAFYRNLGNGHFQDVSVSSWACDYRGGMGIATGDWDNNGQMDLFLTHWLAQEKALYHNLWVQNPGKKPKDRLHFVDISDQVGLGQSTPDYVGWGTSFVDFDNDGRLDLVITNGSTLQDSNDHTLLVPMKNQLFWNGSRQDGYFEHNCSDRGFFEVEDAAGGALSQPNVGRGLAVADYDRDGAPDILITRNGGPSLLLHNDGGARNNWLEVWLQGTRSNRDAIGAKLRITVAGRQQIRQVGAGSSYLSQDDRVQGFGLGAHTSVDTLEVWWPSGLQQSFHHIAARQMIRIVEGGPPRTVHLKRGGKR
ncbi:MAG TPA: CRTAC1 family protein [Chthonomonadaceae bacterium]|nr:CRTAC1 family protein [Chthonomonadaceae bacterium]